MCWRITKGKTPNFNLRAFALLVSLCLIAVGCLAQVPFHQGVNLTQWFQAPSVRQIQFSKFGRDDFEHIKSLGCDVIRLPLNLHAMTDGAPSYTIDPLFFHFLDQVVGWSEELGLHLVLDNHTFDPNDQTDPDVGIVLTKVWSQMAEHYKDRSQLIYYEVLNEPHGITAAAWGQIQQQVIDAIRVVDPDHYIIVGGVNYNSYNDLATLPEYTDQKLIYTFHFYDPFLFTHQGATWTNPTLEPLANVPFPFGASLMPLLPPALRGTWIENAYNSYASDGTAATVRRLIDIAASFSMSRQVPVFCGEFGVHKPNSNDAQRVSWYKLVREHLRDKNIPWTIWDYQGSFGLFEKNSDELFEHDLNTSLLQALSLNVPPQTNPVQPVQTTPLEIYDDYVGEGIVDASKNTAGQLDFYEEDAHDGAFAIGLTDVEQYFSISLDFLPNINLSLLSENMYVLEFWVKGDTPGSSVDMRFVDTKANVADRPWRKGITIDENVAPWDGLWHHVVIPISMLQEKGSYDNGWFAPEGKFSWHDVDRFEIVAEMQSLDGVHFQFDQIRLTGDPIAVTATTPFSPESGFAVYPNPAMQGVRVRYVTKQDGPVTGTLFSMVGRAVRTWCYDSEAAGLQDHRLDIEGIPSGLYILQITSGESTFTRKVAIE